MPLFVSEDEFRLISHDAAVVAERADAFIRDLRRQLDTVRAEADAGSIAAEQTCALLEQKYSSLSSDFFCLQSENLQLSATVEQRLSEIADAQAEKHQLHLKAIGKDGEIERLSMEAAELHKSKRQLLEMLELKDDEIREKNATIQSYLDKIVNLTENATSKEAQLHEAEAELSRCRAACNRVTQEKELLEKHNAWLNEELTAKVNSLVELRRKHMDVEADLSAKLADLERQLNESSSSLTRSEGRVRELERRVNSLEEDLYSSKDAAAANEKQFSAELSTVSKLVELYKTSSEEWSKKAGELEGVIKALEMHLSQVENDYKEKLEKEVSVRNNLEKEAAELREKLEKCETEIEKTRKANELDLLPLSSFYSNMQEIEITNEAGSMIVPRVPASISGTALAASLLRDGWSLAKMYEKYQEASDALRHERWARKHSEAILERVLHEIEEKAGVILDERAEHERMVEAYTLMDQKLQQARMEHDNLENTVRQLKSELKMRERNCSVAEKEIDDLQKQVTVLLKECQDIQLRCGASSQVSIDNYPNQRTTDFGDSVYAERRLSTFRDIKGLVEQNVQLRSLVQSLSSEEEKRNAEIREGFQIQLQKVTDEAAAKVEAVLKRSEEQASMIDSLHTSVSMYKRLYEEERKFRVSSQVYTEENGKKDTMVLVEGSQDVPKKAHEQLSERFRNLEHELDRLRSELLSLRSERDKMALESNFAKERLDSFVKEFDFQRQQANAVSARNVELTHLLVDYQKRVRECSDSLQAAEESSRKLSMEISILKHEREILIGSEKRAADEVRSLSERVHRLQSSLDTIQCTEEVRENARAAERRKHEEYLKKIERDWAEAKKEVQEERDHVRSLTLDREKTIENSMKQVEEMRKELTDAWRAVASAESRAAVAEARCSDLEAKINCSEKKVTKNDGGQGHTALSTSEVNGESWNLKEEMEKLKEEAKVNKDYMLQYKEIARTNEIALKQIESAHEEYKSETEKSKKALDDEVQSLRNKVSELEANYRLKSEEAAFVIETKDNELSLAMTEISRLKEETAGKLTQIETLESRIIFFNDELDKEQKRWRTAQDNYERQVILQSETIQELTNTSKELSLLQSEISKLRECSEAQQTENHLLKVSWEREKLELLDLKNEAEKKYCEINEQNKILHNRLETLHIRLAEKEHGSAGFSSKSLDSEADSDLQNVVSYLRRSKEIAETEMSLLKQEKLRLQSQLESALKASENAQSLLHAQCESSRTFLFKDEEFKSLQLQVREINLLRESNVQLREENKHNFEECQKLREEARKAKIEAENLGNLLREKELEFNACQKEVEMQNLEIGHLNNRIAELLESNKNIDAGEYERMTEELQNIKVLLTEKESELQETKKLASEKQECILNLEQTLAKLAEQEKKLNDALTEESSKLETSKLETDKLKRLLVSSKKKIENLTKEKEELSCKNQALLKQVEDYKSSKKTAGESSNEQAKKEQEKDTRIQMLEKTLERERDDFKKEKSRRLKTERTVVEAIQNINMDKKKVEEELAKHKHAIVIVMKSSGIAASQLPPGSGLDEQTLAYFQSIGGFEEFANSILNEGDGSHSLATDVPVVDASATSAAGRQVPNQQSRPPTPHVRGTEEREKGSSVSKPSIEARKAGRKLVRPRLERIEEPPVEIEMSVMEGSTTMEEGKAGSSLEPELSADTSLLPATSAGKRPATSTVSELREDSVGQDEAGVDVPPLKKSKHSEALQERSAEVQSILSSSEAADPEQQLTVPSSDVSTSQPVPADEVEPDKAPVLANDDIMDAAKDDEDATDIRGETEEQQKEPSDGTNQEDEGQYSGDAIVEDLSDRPSTATELLDECLKSDDVKEILQSAAESEDEREEGELMPDDSEQQQEVSGEGQHESNTGDGGEIGEEAVDAVEVASPEPPIERTEEIDAVEEVTEASDEHNGNNVDQGSIDSAQSPQKSSVAREGSPITVPQGSTEQQSPTPSSTISASETDEAAQTRGSGRTISIAERARQNALLRQSRMAATPPARGGRGRAPAGYRRVPRGGRGGRG